MVAKSVTVIASGSMTGDLKVHFQTTASATGFAVAGHHYIALAGTGDSVTFNVKCKEVYVTGYGADCGYEVFAEMTNIPAESMFSITGSGATDAGSNPRSDR